MKKRIVFLTFHFTFLVLGQSQNQVTQEITGKDFISINILDYETNEPIIGAVVSSLPSGDTLAVSDLYGHASFTKGIKGTIEISYVGYDPLCFKLENDKIDKITARIIFNIIVGDFDIYPYDRDSLWRAAEKDAELDLEKGIVKIIYNQDPSEEQLDFAKNHAFSFSIDQYIVPDYFMFYNKVVLEYLSKKFNTDITEELKMRCWRNYDLRILYN